MLIALALTLLFLLDLLRRLLEPPCPACAAKQWGRGSTALDCAGCGWTNAAPQGSPAAELSAAHAAGSQYESRFH